MIGIDANDKLVYEGGIGHGRGVWPSPFLTPACVIGSDADLNRIDPGPDPARAALIYREDSFDPVTRIRRGRFYSRPEATPQQWSCEPHPAHPIEASYRSAESSKGWHSKGIYGFYEWRASHLSVYQTRVALGFKDAFTLWRVIAIERIITGDDLVTLQALSTLGTIVDLNEAKLPPAHRLIVSEAIEKVVLAAHRFGPESVVDRCRDAAQIMIGARYAFETTDEAWLQEDLGGQVKKLLASEKFRNQIVVTSAASIIARLHARKPNELVTKGLRPLVEEDGAMALQSLSLLIREFGYGLT